VYGLIQAGLVVLVRPEGAPVPTPQTAGRAPAPPQNPAEQKSILNRLISRIRSL
jgi:hypothetical protein